MSSKVLDKNRKNSKILLSTTPNDPSQPSKPHFSKPTQSHIPLIIILPLLSLLGFFLTLNLSSRNGTFASLAASITSENAVFPGTDDLLLKQYTGIRVLDRQLTVLVVFFAAVTEAGKGIGNEDDEVGLELGMRLFSIFGFGQFGAAWVVLWMESMRRGNRGRGVSFITIVGILIQNITYTVTTPLYLFLHLLTSPVTKSISKTENHSDVLIPVLDLHLLPFSLTIGYITPSILMLLPSPTFVSPQIHQKLIALWQAFPIWCIWSHYFLRMSCQSLSYHTSSRHETGSKTLATGIANAYQNAAGKTYRFLLAICICTHLPVFLLAVLSPFMAMSTATSSWQGFSFKQTYIPPFPSTTHSVSSLGKGVHTFLQWDLYIGSTALLLWAISLWLALGSESIQARGRSERGREKEELKERGQWWGLAKRTLVWGTFSGPVGLTIILLWERDKSLLVTAKLSGGFKLE